MTRARLNWFALPLCATLPLLLLLAGCNGLGPAVRGSGNVATETRAVSGFSEIDLAGIGDVRVEQTGSESLTIEAEDNLLPLLTTEVRNGCLTLGTKENLRPTRPIVFRITVDRLEAVRVSGSGDVRVEQLQSPRLDARISGSGRLRVVRLDTPDLDADISGSGSATFAGRADEVRLDVSGSGAFNAADLKAADARVSIAGSGSATVHATERLSADISGSGAVHYLGDPQVSRHVSGSGSIVRR